MLLSSVKFKWKIFSNFVAFSEYSNFNKDWYIYIYIYENQNAPTELISTHFEHESISCVIIFFVHCQQYLDMSMCPSYCYLTVTCRSNYDLYFVLLSSLGMNKSSDNCGVSISLYQNFKSALTIGKYFKSIIQLVLCRSQILN